MKQNLSWEEKKILDSIKQNKFAADYFFQKVSDLKWFDILKDESFFSPEKAPDPKPASREGFYVIPYWNVLAYLERVSQKASMPEYEEYADKLLDIIKNVTNYHQETKKLDNYHIWVSFIKILSNLPSEKITDEILDLIPVWLESKFSISPQIFEVKNLILKFLKVEPKKAEKIIKFLIDIIRKDTGEEILYLLHQFFKANLHLIAEKCSIEIVNLFSNKIKELTSTDYDGTLNSFYEYEEADYLLYQPIEFLSFILSKILIVKSITDPEPTKKILESFLDEEHPIFTKIALFIIGEQFEKFKDFFWDIFKKSGEKILLGCSLFWGDELKKVLEKISSLTDSQRDLLMEKINNSINKILELSENASPKEMEREISLFRQRIYRALSEDPVFKTEYESVKKITEVDAELGPAIGVVQPVIETSPLTKEEILDMPNEELTDFIVKFKTESFFGGPTVEELARTLSIAVKTNPQKFVQNLTPFLKVGYLYASKLLDGLTYALKENKFVAYKPVFNFVENYINREGFWKNELKVEAAVVGGSYESFISHFCDFIVEKFNTKDEEETFFDDAERLLNLILQHLKSEKPSAQTYNYVFYSFNSPLGKVLETYIKLVSKSPASKRSSLKENFLRKYKQLLDDNIIEAYTFFGFYISFFYKEAKEFTLDFISRINTATNEWEAFMTGYFYSSYFYWDLYNLMKNHYEASLSYNFKDVSVKKSFIQHLSLAYLLNLENLTDSDLFYMLVHNLDPIVISEIIYFFYSRWKSYKTEEISQIKNRILNFWTFVYDTLKFKPKETLTESDKKILSRSTNLSIYLTRPEEPYISYLKYTAEFLEQSDFVVLSKVFYEWIKVESSVQTAKIIAEILKNAPVFNFPRDKIESFIKYFYETGDREVVALADSICDNYIKNGAFFVKEICEKFHRTP